MLELVQAPVQLLGKGMHDKRWHMGSQCEAAAVFVSMGKRLRA
jgi:hypothetical protein